MTLQHPRQGQVYTLREIVQKLYLRDSPSLGVPAPKLNLGLFETADWGQLQKSHVDYTAEAFLEQYGDLKFTYVRETFEWIPVFRFAGTLEEIMEVADFEPCIETHLTEGRPLSWWITFKGYGREQYYVVSECGDYVKGCMGDEHIPYQLKALLAHLKTNPL